MLFEVFQSSYHMKTFIHTLDQEGPTGVARLPLFALYLLSGYDLFNMSSLS